MNILSLDLGTKCGWALKRKNHKVKYGTLDLAKNHAFDGCGMQYIKFRKWLAEQQPLDLVVFEAVLAHNPGSVHAQHKYGGILATLQTFCDDQKIPYCGENVATIKKYWLGTAAPKRSTKKHMMAECRKRGFNPADDNQADAIALLHLGIVNYELFL